MSKKLELTSFEIRVVANGYWLAPHSRMNGELSRNDEIFVFESFDSLSNFLAANMKALDK